MESTDRDRTVSRRSFLQAGAASIALSAMSAEAMDAISGKPKRVGLIGAGWYGKSDLWRLIQVAPVDVISICDPDQNMLAEAVEIASQRQKSGKKPRTYNDYREVLIFPRLAAFSPISTWNWVAER